jgi:hypothetical protein
MPRLKLKQKEGSLSRIRAMIRRLPSQWLYKIGIDRLSQRDQVDHRKIPTCRQKKVPYNASGPRRTDFTAKCAAPFADRIPKAIEAVYASRIDHNRIRFKPGETAFGHGY